jgi:hypothetical protein
LLEVPQPPIPFLYAYSGLDCMFNASTPEICMLVNIELPCLTDMDDIYSILIYTIMLN